MISVVKTTNLDQDYKSLLDIESLTMDNEGLYYCQLKLDNLQTINVTLIADAVGLTF